jgi:uncharacterized protein (DUF433 family)
MDVLEMLASGMSPADITSEHPSLQLEDISACLKDASKQLDHAIFPHDDLERSNRHE